MSTNEISTSVHEDFFSEIIASWNIKKTEVVKALYTVPRHKFLPRNLQGEAYKASCVTIPGGYSMSHPGLVAYMIEALQLEETDRVLDVGLGTGYHAALISRIVTEVYGIEIISEVVERASSTLKSLGYENIAIQAGDGSNGWKEQSPFDAINIACSVNSIPYKLVSQLKEGGRMIFPLAPENLPPERAMQQLILLTKEKEGGVKNGILYYPLITTKVLINVRFMLMTASK